MVGDSVSLHYFVAIPAFREGTHGKELMSVMLKFPAGAQQIRVVDAPFTVEFPVSDEPGTETTPAAVIKDIAKYEIFIGWQLTPDELAFNRKATKDAAPSFAQGAR